MSERIESTSSCGKGIDLRRLCSQESMRALEQSMELVSYFAFVSWLEPFRQASESFQNSLWKCLSLFVLLNTLLEQLRSPSRNCSGATSSFILLSPQNLIMRALEPFQNPLWSLTPSWVWFYAYEPPLFVLLPAFSMRRCQRILPHMNQACRRWFHWLNLPVAGNMI